MCQKRNCYTGCENYGSCVFHSIITCDHCGKRIQPKDLRTVYGSLFACSVEHAEILQNRVDKSRLELVLCGGD